MNQKHSLLSQNCFEAGWTFIETIVVIGIILVLSGSVGFVAVGYLERAKSATAKSQVETLSLAMQSLYLDCGRNPSQSEGLEALWKQPADLKNWNGPYLAKPVKEDPWGRPYEYVNPVPGSTISGIRSLGSDGLPGGEGNAQDIASWE